MFGLIKTTKIIISSVNIFWLIAPSMSHVLIYEAVEIEFTESKFFLLNLSPGPQL